MDYTKLRANLHTFPFIDMRTFIHGKFSVPKYMQLIVVGSKVNAYPPDIYEPMTRTTDFRQISVTANNMSVL